MKMKRSDLLADNVGVKHRLCTKRELQFNRTFMSIAFNICQLGTCNRASVGCVLVKDNKIISIGYNGAPSKVKHCSEAGCFVSAGHCVRAVHAEANAISNSLVDTAGATAYVTHRPCLNCTKALINAKIDTIYWSTDYAADGDLREKMIEESGIKVRFIGDYT